MSEVRTEGGKIAAPTSIEKQANAGSWPIKIGCPTNINVTTGELPLSQKGATSPYYRHTRPSYHGTLIYIPGTAHTAYAPQIINPVCANLAERLHMQVIVIYPRLSIQNRYPNPIIDISTMINGLLDQPDKFGIDPHRVCLGGYSAGGALAILSCLEGLKKVRRLPFTHLFLLTPAVYWGADSQRVYRAKPDKGHPKHFVNSTFFNESARNFIPKNLDPTSGLVSPLSNPYQDFIGFPPVVIIYGEREFIAPDIRQWLSLLKKADVKLNITTLAEDHTFPWKKTYYLNNKLKQMVKEQFDNGGHHDVSARLPILPAKHCDSLTKSPSFNQHKHVRRIQIMGACKTCFEQAPPANETLTVFAFTGMGSAGKTQGALGFYNHYGRYKYRLWFSATDRHTLTQQFKKLAIELGLINSTNEEAVYIDLIKQWINQQGNCLIVFDDAKNAVFLNRYLPQKGHVIVTSRHKEWENKINIQEMLPEESSRLTRHYLKQHNKYSIKDIDHLTKKLGYLPLAMRQASAHIKYFNISILEYLSLYEHYATELSTQDLQLKNIDHISAWISLKITANKLSYQQLTLLYCFAFLSADRVHRELLKADNPFNIDNVNTTLWELGENLSMIHYTHSVKGAALISMHTVTQDFFRAHCSQDEKKRIRVINYLLESLVDSQLGEHVVFPQLLSLITHIEDMQLTEKINREYLVKAYIELSYLHIMPSQSLSAAKKAHEYAAYCLPSTQADAFAAQGHACWISGDVLGSVETREKELAIWTQVNDQVKIGKAKHNLATGYMRLGRLTEAKKKFDEASRIFVQHCEQAEVLANIPYILCVNRVIRGFLEIDFNHPQQAIAFADEANRILNQYSDNIPPKQQEIIQLLISGCKGKAWLKQWDSDASPFSKKQATNFLNESLELRKKLKGEQDRLVAEAYMPLAKTCDSLAESIKYIKQALRIFYRLHQKNNFFIADTYWMAADTLLNHGKRQLALCFYQQSLAIFKEEIPELYYAKHPKMQHICSKLGIKTVVYDKVPPPMALNKFSVSIFKLLDHVSSCKSAKVNSQFWSHQSEEVSTQLKATGLTSRQAKL